MPVEPFNVEQWMDEYETIAKFNLAVRVHHSIKDTTYGNGCATKHSLYMC